MSIHNPQHHARLEELSEHAEEAFESYVESQHEREVRLKDFVLALLQGYTNLSVRVSRIESLLQQWLDEDEAESSSPTNSEPDPDPHE
ncbi:MAG TPA: hypothetical protein VIM84_15440 [Gemmatimonadales bacterium]